MTSYRFCRPDDMQLIIEAMNRCFVGHFPGVKQIDQECYKVLVRKANLWASSCMIAFEGSEKETIALIAGCKRENETEILLAGSHPAHLRKGHVSQMIESLCSKLAILGPPLVVAYVPEDNAAALGLFHKLGFESDRGARPGQSQDVLSELGIMGSFARMRFLKNTR